MRALLWVALLLAASPAPAQPQARLTYQELRTLPDEALAQRLFGALAPDIVLSLRPDFPRNPLPDTSIWAWTRPRASWLPGLCETDRSILTFEPDHLSAGGANRENPAMRLAQIQTHTYYIVHDRALAEGRTRPDPEHPDAWAAACGGLDPRGENVPADHPMQLMRAYSLINELGAAARAGRAHVPLDCSRMRWNGPQPDGEAACLRALRGLGDHSLTQSSEWSPRPRSARRHAASPSGCGPLDRKSVV